jgi:cytochrome d ubiquinol oxidase subunit II
MIFDYPTLKVIWWLLIGVLLIGFAIMDGHDMGVGTLLPFIGRTDTERRVIINTVGPHWEGNQVWFVTGGGAIFAAWPLVYATAFSGFYWGMLMVLWVLFFRPVGFDYRSKIHNVTWRACWDWGLFIGSAMPPFLFGVVFGNLLQGVPFHFDRNMNSHYTGSFWGLLNPFALLVGVVSTAMITFQGAIYLAHRTEGDIQQRARHAAQGFGLLMLAGFTVAGIWLGIGNFGYVITSVIDPAAASAPLAKTVIPQAGAWLANYRAIPATLLMPVLTYLGGILAMILVARGRTLPAFVASSIAIVGIIGTAGVSMFPFVMPSSSMPNASLTVWDSVSSQRTLSIMLWVVVVFMPLIIFYTRWAYGVMAGKVTAAYIHENEHTTY